jgi:hypothetical protein
MALDPFTDCPFGILGLPEYSTEGEVIQKWKKLVLNEHPDKNEASEISTKKTQIYNDAKQRAVSMIASGNRNLAQTASSIFDDETKQLHCLYYEDMRIMYEQYFFCETEAHSLATPNNKEDSGVGFRVPSFSAWKRNNQPLYEVARKCGSEKVQ